MGVPRGVVRLLLEEAKARPFSGSVLQLGKMSIYCTQRELETWAREQGVALAQGVTPELSHDPALARLGCLSDRSFFQLLGFSEVRSCDFSDWEGADLILDLNGDVPAELVGRFDVVFEAGTIQHVFHLPNVLRNVHRLLEVGGRVIHGMVPSSNHVDHGFYMFSPTLFWDYYTANGYRLESEYFFEFLPAWFGGKLASGRWKIYRYEPGCLDHLSYGRFGGRQLGIFVVATKTPEASCDVIPQQGYFVRFWRQPAALEPSARGVALERFLIGRPALLAVYLLTKRLRERIRRLLPRKMPPVVARF
ncbi:MAG: hypothetical protein HC897_12740 [Thermoanaerobaculia bacterium]|nr:hypothetical protein [Thermoanaerobaculia bacterium]